MPALLHQTPTYKLAAIGLVALLYWASGQLGLLLAIPPGYATAFWPASGLALAAVLWGGRILVVGVVIGSLVLNLQVSLHHAGALGPPAYVAAAGIAGFAGLQALFGHWLTVRALGKGSWSRQTTADLLTLIVWGGPVAYVVAANGSSLLLFIVGFIDSSQLFANIAIWWLGDSLGVLVFTPVTLMALRSRQQLPTKLKLITILPLLTLFGLIAGSYFYLRTHVEQQLHTEVGHRVAESEALINSETLRAYHIVDSTRALFLASSQVERNEFDHFAQLVLDKPSGIRSLAWAPEVLANQRDSWRQRAKNEGIKDFDFWEFHDHTRSPRVQTANYCPLFFVYPSASNNLLGLDIYTLAESRPALTRAKQDGSLIATPINLPDFPGDNYWLLVRSIGQGRDAGLIVAVLDLQPLFTGAKALLSDKSIGLKITDVLSQKEIYNSGNFDPTSNFTQRQNLTIGLRPLYLDFALTSQAANRQLENRLWPLLCGGFLFAGLLAIFIINATSANELLISKVQQHTQDLEDERQYLHAIIENLPLLLFVKEPDNLTVTHMNKLAETTTGFSREEYLGKTDFDFFSKERAKALNMSDRAVLDSGEMQDSGETLLHLRSGLRWIHTRKVPVKDAQGKNRFLLIFAEDVTHKREQANTFNTVVDNMPVGLLIVAEDGAIRYANPHALELFAMPGEGVNLAQLIPADLRDNHTNMVARFFANPGVSALAAVRELQAQTFTGQPFDAEIALTSIRWHGEKCALAIVSDVSQKHEIRRQLREREAHLRLVLASLGEGVCGLDAEGQIAFANAAASMLLGYSESELIGQPFDRLVLLQTSAPSPTAAAYRQGHMQRAQGLGMQHKEGRLLWVDYVTTPLFGDRGNILGAVIVFSESRTRTTA